MSLPKANKTKVYIKTDETREIKKTVPIIDTFFCSGIFPAAADRSVFIIVEKPGLNHIGHNILR